MFQNYLYAILLLVLCFNSVNGLCPYAYQPNDVLEVKGYDHISNEIESSSEKYLSSVSFDTYQTVCHRFVAQPPPIPSEIIEHALMSAANQTAAYTILDTAAAEAVGAHPAQSLTDMDRINFFFESATRYVQETTCSSKETTTLFLPTVELANITKYFPEDITTISCDNANVSYPDCDWASSVRPIDGTCNNLKRPQDGSVGDCMQRLLEPDYKDGISGLRCSTDGTPLPNPTVLSDALFGGTENR